MLALMMTAACCTAAAETVCVEPFHELNMETYGTEDCTVSASFSSSDIDENNVLCYSVYSADLYDADKVLALKPGDVLFVNNEELTVKTVGIAEGGVDINGGFFNESGEEGATLCYVDGDPDHMYSLQYDDQKAMTMLGQAADLLADQVTVRSYHLNADLDFDGEYDEVTLPAAEVKAYLAKLEEGMIVFGFSGTKLTMVNGRITEIFVDWTPNA